MSLGAVHQIEVPLEGANGIALRIGVLPRSSIAGDDALLDRRNDVDLEPGVPPIQLLENCELLYEWVGVPKTYSVVTDPEEIFYPDTGDGARGRLRPGLAVGTVNVVLRSSDRRLGNLELEVRSRKLAYQSEYRWMLRDIAADISEIVMERFAASESVFSQDETRDAITLYQRFAFLSALFTNESFQSALGEIVRRPHVAWREKEEVVRPGEPVRPSGRLARQLAGPGQRIPWPPGPIRSIPARLKRSRTEATHDTTPNRFVKFALERWRSVMLDIDRALAKQKDSPAVRRGHNEIAHTVDQLDSVLHMGLFRGLSPLARFPSDDQVLQRREGYREVFGAYLEFELAAQLSWTRSAANYKAGQHDIAVLYEYWAFVQLAKVVAELVGSTFSLAELVEKTGDGLNVALQSGRETILKGTTERFGRRIDVEFCFNRTFTTKNGELTSWTRPMRPDFSLIVRASQAGHAEFEPMVLHFDAKYRVSFLSELFGGEEEVITSGDPEPRRGGALRSDLLKMHAYRDAIRRSAGAYVLFPGGDAQIEKPPFAEYRELLPGLGAFVLRPSRDGEATGSRTLRRFLNDVLDHVAMRLTQHERGRYWLEEVYGRSLPPISEGDRDIQQPGPDTTVLVGYVKNKLHWDWILDRKTYNVRATGRVGGVAESADLLRAHFLLLYCPSTGEIALTRIASDPEFVDKTAMEKSGYPVASGDYLCIQWRWASLQKSMKHLTPERIQTLVQNRGLAAGTPVMVRWFDLANLGP